MSPRPVTEWTDRPVARTALDVDEHPPALIEQLPIDSAVVGVWGNTQASVQRTSIPATEIDDDAVVDLVIETPDEYHLYSYVHHNGTPQWVCYDPETKGSERAHRFERRLDAFSYYSGSTERV